jgi:hypothetical protein
VADNIISPVLPRDSADVGIKGVDEQVIGPRHSSGAQQRQAENQQKEAWAGFGLESNVMGFHMVFIGVCLVHECSLRADYAVKSRRG